MMYRVLPLVGALLLSGCANLLETKQPTAPLIKPPSSEREAIEIAGDLVQRGRWNPALETLEVALQAFPASVALQQERQRVTERWAYERQLIEDRILVSEAEHQQYKISQMARLARAEPENVFLISRRLYWKEVLAAKLDDLTRCGEAYVEAEPELAQRCYDVALDQSVPEMLEVRLAAVGNRLRAAETAAATTRRLRARRERQARAKVMMDEAKRAIDERDYRRALDVLDRVEKLKPGNDEVSGLREQARSMISPQIDALVKLGDHLYLDEQLEAASATWNAALSLQPGDPDIIARIERAKTVMQRLRALRERKQVRTPAVRATGSPDQ